MMEICFSPDTYIEKRKVFLLLLQREPLKVGGFKLPHQGWNFC